MLKKFLLLPLLVAALLLLSGCYKVDSEITIDGDGNATATGSVAFPKKLKGEAYKKAMKQVKKAFPAGTKFVNFTEGGLRGSAFTTPSVPVEELLGGKAAVTYEKLGEVHKLSSAGLTGVTAKKLTKRYPKTATAPSWMVKINFPTPVTEVSDGLAFEGSFAIIPSEVLLSGQAWSITASPAVKEAKPVVEDLPSDMPTERSPIPTYFFSFLILAGLAMAIGGRYMNFTKPKKPKKAKK